MVSDTTALCVSVLVEQLTRAADRGYTVRGEPDASTLMRQAAEALSAQPTVDREAIARIIDPEALRTLEDHRSEWAKLLVDEQVKIDERIDVSAMLDRLGAQGFGGQKAVRHRALAKADAILALLHPIDDITYAGSEPEGGAA